MLKIAIAVVLTWIVATFHVINLAPSRCIDPNTNMPIDCSLVAGGQN